MQGQLRAWESGCETTPPVAAKLFSSQHTDPPSTKHAQTEPSNDKDHLKSARHAIMEVMNRRCCLHQCTLGCGRETGAGCVTAATFLPTDPIEVRMNLSLGPTRMHTNKHSYVTLM